MIFFVRGGGVFLEFILLNTVVKSPIHVKLLLFHYSAVYTQLHMSTIVQVTSLQCTALYCTHCTVLHCTALHFTTLRCTESVSRGEEGSTGKNPA